MNFRKAKIAAIAALAGSTVLAPKGYLSEKLI